jgi:hypothetical protein
MAEAKAEAKAGVGLEAGEGSVDRAVARVVGPDRGGRVVAAARLVASAVERGQHRKSDTDSTRRRSWHSIPPKGSRGLGC